MHTIRIVKCPVKGDALDVQGIIFTFGEDVGIVKDNYHKSAMNLAKALLDVGHTVRVRQGIYKETTNEKGNTIKSIGTEIDFNTLIESTPENKIYIEDMPISGDNITTETRNMIFTTSMFATTIFESLKRFSLEHGIRSEPVNEGDGIWSLDVGEKVINAQFTSGKNYKLNTIAKVK